MVISEGNFGSSTLRLKILCPLTPALSPAYRQAGARGEGERLKVLGVNGLMRLHVREI